MSVVRFQKAGNWEVVKVIGGRTNCYLVSCDEIKILVDTGKKSKLKKLIRNLKDIGFQLDSITHLFLTHTHFDHCQSAAHIQEISGCKIIMSKSVLNQVNEGYTKLPKGTNPITSLITIIGKRFGKRNHSYKPFIANILVDDKLSEILGLDNLEIVATPGHSKDSISLIVGGEIAIVGDAMFGVFKKSIFPPFADDLDLMLSSWQILYDSGCHIFLPGHGRPISRQLLIKEINRMSSFVKY